jgi:hypothetical protein
VKHKMFESGYGAACFRCGLFEHVITEPTCDGRLFPNVSEIEIELAERYAAQPKGPATRPYIEAHAFLAGMRTAAKALVSEPNPDVTGAPV